MLNIFISQIILLDVDLLQTFPRGLTVNLHKGWQRSQCFACWTFSLCKTLKQNNFKNNSNPPKYNLEVHHYHAYYLPHPLHSECCQSHYCQEIHLCCHHSLNQNHPKITGYYKTTFKYFLHHSWFSILAPVLDERSILAQLSVKLKELYEARWGALGSSSSHYLPESPASWATTYLTNQMLFSPHLCPSSLTNIFQDIKWKNYDSFPFHLSIFALTDLGFQRIHYFLSGLHNG